MKFIVINGPNLNLLGRREPEIYGHLTLSQIEDQLRAAMPGHELVCHQSNHEGEIIDLLHRYGFDPQVAGIVLNPGAFAHYSYAIADAIAAIRRPVVEVHLSDIATRAEEWRHRSVTAPYCRTMISGMGPQGYVKALKLLEAEA